MESKCITAGSVFLKENGIVSDPLHVYISGSRFKVKRKSSGQKKRRKYTVKTKEIK